MTTTCGGARPAPGPDPDSSPAASGPDQGSADQDSGPGRPAVSTASPGPEHGPLISSIWSWLVDSLVSRSSGLRGGLRGKRALVSGSGGGLGRELSLQLVGHGCKVICVDQDALQVQETLGLLQAMLLQKQEGRSRDTRHAVDDVLEGVARGYACDWRHPEEALGLSRAVTSTEGGVDLIFVVPESNNNNESAVDSAGKVVGCELWPLLGFLPGMMARARGHVVHVLDEQIAHKTGVVADAWVESLQEVGADVRYTKVHLHSDQASYHPCRTEDAARAILAAVRQGSTEVHIAYPVC